MGVLNLILRSFKFSQLQTITMANYNKNQKALAHENPYEWLLRTDPNEKDQKKCTECENDGEMHANDNNRSRNKAHTNRLMETHLKKGSRKGEAKKTTLDFNNSQNKCSFVIKKSTDSVKKVRIVHLNRQKKHTHNKRFAHQHDEVQKRGGESGTREWERAKVTRNDNLFWHLLNVPEP